MGKQQIGPREQQLRDLRERASSNGKAKKTVVRALNAKVAAIPAKKAKKARR